MNLLTGAIIVMTYWREGLLLALGAGLFAAIMRLLLKNFWIFIWVEFLLVCAVYKLVGLSIPDLDGGALHFSVAGVEVAIAAAVEFTIVSSAIVWIMHRKKKKHLRRMQGCISG